MSSNYGGTVADFCKQCSIEHFGQDFGDLANLMSPELYNDNQGAVAICEGCYHAAGCIVEIDGTCCVRKRLESWGIYPDPDGSKETLYVAMHFKPWRGISMENVRR